MLIRTDYIIDTDGPIEREVIGAAPRKYNRPRNIPGCIDRHLDQLKRALPIETHAALSRVHRFRHPQAAGPQITPVRDGCFPIDRGFDPRIYLGEGVSHDMRSSQRDPVEITLRLNFP